MHTPKSTIQMVYIQIACLILFSLGCSHFPRWKDTMPPVTKRALESNEEGNIHLFAASESTVRWGGGFGLAVHGFVPLGEVDGDTHTLAGDIRSEDVAVQKDHYDALVCGWSGSPCLRDKESDRENTQHYLQDALANLKKWAAYLRAHSVYEVRCFVVEEGPRLWCEGIAYRTAP